jgi:hypothetical protein
MLWTDDQDQTPIDAEIITATGANRPVCLNVRRIDPSEERRVIAWDGPRPLLKRICLTLDLHLEGCPPDLHPRDKLRLNTQRVRVEAEGWAGEWTVAEIRSSFATGEPVRSVVRILTWFER